MVLLEERGVVYETVEIDPPPLTAMDVAVALKMPVCQVVKTLALVFRGNEPNLVLLTGGERLRFGALTRALGVRRSDVSNMTTTQLEEWLGMEPGNITPLGVQGIGKVHTSPSIVALTEERVVVGSGLTGLGILISAADLVATVDGDCFPKIEDDDNE